MDQAGLRAYSQVYLVSAGTIPGGMINNDSGDDEYVRAPTNQSISSIQAPSNMAATTEAPRAAQRDQTTVPAEAGSGLLQEQDFYEESCNNTPLAKLF